MKKIIKINDEYFDAETKEKVEVVEESLEKRINNMLDKFLFDWRQTDWKICDKRVLKDFIDQILLEEQGKWYSWGWEDCKIGIDFDCPQCMEKLSSLKKCPQCGQSGIMHIQYH